MFTRQCLGHRRIPDLKTLRRQSRAWNRRVNRTRPKSKWRFYPKTARQKFGYKKLSLRSQELEGLLSDRYDAPVALASPAILLGAT
jgi:hypothetical protein